MENFLAHYPKKIRRELYQGFSLLFWAIFFIFRFPIGTCRKKRIIFVDFRYSGNLRAFFQYAYNKADIEFGFMPADPADFKSLKESLPKEVRLLSRLNLKDMLWAYRANVFLTSIMMRRFLTITKIIAPHIQFVQVFHTMNLLGEPYSWFDAMSKYDKVFCASEEIVKTFEDITHQQGHFIATGYAVVDELFSDHKKKKDIFLSNDLDPYKKTILFSPTLSSAIEWAPGNQLYPYAKEFLAKLEEWASLKNVQIIFRNHPHEEFDETIFTDLRAIKLLNSKAYKNVSKQLLVADVMITDLSGIGGYFISLQKPIIFLVNPSAPNDSNHIYFLKPNELPGPRVKTYDELISNLEDILNNEQKVYKEKYDMALKEAFKKLYGKYFDGNAAKRYLENLCNE